MRPVDLRFPKGTRKDFTIVMLGCGLASAIGGTIANYMAPIPESYNILGVFGLVLAAVCVLLSGLIRFARLSWKAWQFGLVGSISMFAFLYLFSSIYLSMVVYASKIEITIRLIMLAVLFLTWYLSYYKTTVFFKRIWSNKDAINSSFIEYEDGVLLAKTKLTSYYDNSSWHKLSIIVSILALLIMAVSLYFYREIIAYFGVEFKPIVFAMFGLLVSPFFVAGFTGTIWSMIVFPYWIGKEKDKQVYIDIWSSLKEIKAYDEKSSA